MNNYAYPLRDHWTKEDIALVINFLVAVEECYQEGLALSRLQSTYRGFKEVVPSKGEEKQIDREFEDGTGYSSYQVVKAMKTALQSKAPDDYKIRMDVK